MLKSGIIDRFMELEWYKKILCVPAIIILIPILLIVVVMVIIAKGIQYAGYVLFDDY